MATDSVTFTKTTDSSKSWSAYDEDSCGNRAPGSWASSNWPSDKSLGSFASTGPTTPNKLTVYPPESAPASGSYTIVWTSSKVSGKTHTITVTCDIKANKTSITVTFSGNRGTLKWIDCSDNANGDRGFGCDEDGDGQAELYLPASIWTICDDISYTITGVSSVPSVLKISWDAQRFHLKQEVLGSKSFTPTALSGSFNASKGDCSNTVNNQICKQVETDCCIYAFTAFLTDDTNYTISVVDNTNYDEEVCG